MEQLCIVYVTTSGKDEAMKIGERLVSMRLGACATVNEEVTSFYWWEGKQHKDQEAELVIKTKVTLLPELKKAIKELHSYSCPCILAVPVIDVDVDYAEWIIRETK
ncbi:MAG: divalent-cation tolerance protein CutA [Candidatus Omnitrophota bacterium]